MQHREEEEKPPQPELQITIEGREGDNKSYNWIYMISQVPLLFIILVISSSYVPVRQEII
jgi:hypothetical protein